MDKSDILLSQSTAVRSFVIEEVLSVVNKHRIEANSINEYSTNIKEWLNPIIDLQGFSVYPMNGVTEAINWWTLIEDRKIKKMDGDYQWVNQRRPQLDETIWYQSIPSSIDGNFKEPLNESALALDLAYIGSTEIKKISISNNVEYLFFSLSKGFGLRNFRIGWLFTKKPDLELEKLIYGAKYYNYFAATLGEKIIEKFSVDFIYKKIRPIQLQICEQLNLKPSDSVWLAQSEDEKYSKFRRTGRNARICLSPLIREELNGV